MTQGQRKGRECLNKQSLDGTLIKAVIVVSDKGHFEMYIYNNM